MGGNPKPHQRSRFAERGIMKRLIPLLLLCFLWSPFRSIAATPLSADMRMLCKKADSSVFVPQAESLIAPQNDPLLHSIEMGGKASEITSLLNGRHPDSIVVNGATPLLIAAVTNNWPAAKALISLGADINFTQAPDITLTPLEAAASNSNYAFACKLIENNAKLPSPKEGKNSFFSSALLTLRKDRERDGAIFVEHLLKNGFDPNDRGSPRETPLMRAVATNNVPLTRILLRNGARLDPVKNGDRTVWGVAIEKNNPHILRLLKNAQKKAPPT